MSDTVKIKIWRENCCGSGTSEYEVPASTDLDQWVNAWDDKAEPELQRYTVWAWPGDIERPTLDDLILKEHYYGPDEGCGDEDCPLNPDSED